MDGGGAQEESQRTEGQRGGRFLDLPSPAPTRPRQPIRRSVSAPPRLDCPLPSACQRQQDGRRMRVPCRLEVEPDPGLTLSFHPREQSIASSVPRPFSPSKRDILSRNLTSSSPGGGAPRPASLRLPLDPLLRCDRGLGLAIAKAD